MGWTRPLFFAAVRSENPATRAGRFPMVKSITIGIDAAKRVFYLHGQNELGRIVLCVKN
jgi:hypothetical protein